MGMSQEKTDAYGGGGLAAMGCFVGKAAMYPCFLNMRLQDGSWVEGKHEECLRGEPLRKQLKGGWE